MIRVFLLFAICVAPVLAGNPVGSVTSQGPIELNGSSIPATAVVSLPVVAGDEITTLDSGVMIVFADRSRAIVEPKSRVKIEAGAAALLLRIVQGGAKLYQSKGSSIRLIPMNPAGTQAGQSVLATLGAVNGRSDLASALTPSIVPLSHRARGRSKECPHEDGPDHNCGFGNDKIR